MAIPGGADKIIHAIVRVGETTILASDGRCQGPPTFQGFALSITTPGPSENQRLFAALGDGGQVLMPLMQTFFSPSFGMVIDRFGVSWMLYVAPEGKAASARAESLASQFEVKVREAEDTLQRLSDADWKEVTAGEKWSVGVTAHHAAEALEPISQMIRAVAAGQPIESFTMERLDAMNAQHARDFAACTKAETVELLRRGAALAARTVRALSDADLGRKGQVMEGMPPMSVEELATAALLGHLDEHFGSIRKTAGH
jgi:predicted 3-demethylubiquinone-9 3-methyltransferase (glyoxalase superfamily)